MNSLPLELADRAHVLVAIENKTHASSRIQQASQGSRHVGIIKNQRGGWTFQAIGYDRDGRPQPGAGPCSRYHGVGLESPGREALIRRLSSEA